MEQNKDKEKTRTIKVSEENYKKLAKLGTLEDSFDSVISMLLDTHGVRLLEQRLAGYRSQFVKERA